MREWRHSSMLVIEYNKAKSTFLGNAKKKISHALIQSLLVFIVWNSYKLDHHRCDGKLSLPLYFLSQSKISWRTETPFHSQKMGE
jgi:hypothetical protein